MLNLVNFISIIQGAHKPGVAGHGRLGEPDVFQRQESDRVSELGDVKIVNFIRDGRIGSIEDLGLVGRRTGLRKWNVPVPLSPEEEDD